MSKAPDVTAITAPRAAAGFGPVARALRAHRCACNGCAKQEHAWGAVRPGRGDEAEGVAPTQRQDFRLEFRGCNKTPIRAGRWCRVVAGAQHMRSRCRAGPKPLPFTGRRRRRQRDPYLHISQTRMWCTTSSGHAAAHFRDAGARRLPQMCFSIETSWTKRCCAGADPSRIQAKNISTTARARCGSRRRAARLAEGSKAAAGSRIWLCLAPLQEFAAYCAMRPRWK